MTAEPSEYGPDVGVDNVAFNKDLEKSVSDVKTDDSDPQDDTDRDEKKDYGQDEGATVASASTSITGDEVDIEAEEASETETDRHKWLVLLAAFLCRMLGEGYANSMGIFFVEFLEYFHSGRGVTGWVVSLTSGIMYGAGIPISFIVYKTNERVCCIGGALLACTGLVISYFATSVIFLLATFGIVTGIGMALIQISYAIAIGRNFKENRASATAVCEMGVTVGGLVFPILLRYLIDTYSWRGAVLISGGILLNMMAMGILFAPLPPPRVKTTGATNQCDEIAEHLKTTAKYCAKDITRTRTFIVYVCIAALVGLGYFFPYGTIVDLGNIRGFARDQSTYLVMILSVANTVGVAIMAALLKLFRRHSTLLYVCNTCFLGLSLYIFAFTTSYGTLVLAIILYGLPSGGLYGVYAVVVLELLGMEHYTTGLGFACSSYGVGMALSTPVAGWINDVTGDYEKSFYIAGSICLGAALIFGVTLLVDGLRKRCRI